LEESDLSSFKAQIIAPESQPEIVPVTTATSQAIKQNFICIQQEIESLFTPYRTAQPIELAPINSQTKRAGPS
jgi:hypothetical protein